VKPESENVQRMREWGHRCTMMRGGNRPNYDSVSIREALHLDPEKFPGLVNDLQESLPVAVVPKYRPSLVATAGHMVPGARVFDAKRSCHGPSLGKFGVKVNSGALTPFSHFLLKQNNRSVRRWRSTVTGFTSANLKLAEGQTRGNSLRPRA
jgi:hypothetical protein